MLVTSSLQRVLVRCQDCGLVLYVGDIDAEDRV